MFANGMGKSYLGRAPMTSGKNQTGDIPAS